MKKISLEELKKDLPEWQALFPVETEVTFLLGAGIWVDVFSLTGVIKEVTDDPTETFVVEINKPELLTMPQYFHREETDTYRAVVHGSMIMKLDECPKGERPWIDKGQSIIESVTDEETLVEALKKVVEGIEDDHGYMALMTLNRVDAPWADKSIKQALLESKFVFANSATDGEPRTEAGWDITMTKGVEKLKRIITAIEGDADAA